MKQFENPNPLIFFFLLKENLAIVRNKTVNQLGHVFQRLSTDSEHLLNLHQWR